MLTLISMVLTFLVTAVRFSLKLALVGIELSQKISERALSLQGGTQSEKAVIRTLSKTATVLLRILITASDILIILLSIWQVLVFLLVIFVILVMVAIAYFVVSGGFM